MPSHGLSSTPPDFGLLLSPIPPSRSLTGIDVGKQSPKVVTYIPHLGMFDRNRTLRPDKLRRRRWRITVPAHLPKVMGILVPPRLLRALSRLPRLLVPPLQVNHRSRYAMSPKLVCLIHRQRLSMAIMLTGLHPSSVSPPSLFQKKRKMFCFNRSKLMTSR